MRCDALRQVAVRLNEGCRVLTLAGAAGGAKALTIAHAILAESQVDAGGRDPHGPAAPHRSFAVLAISNVEAQNVAQEIKFYLNLLSPAPPEVIHLPSLEVDPYRGLSPHPEIAAARAQAIWQLLQDGTRILVASARAAAVRLHNPQRFLSHCLELKQNDEYAPEAARRFLQEVGYIEDDPVTDPGEFALDLVDMIGQKRRAARLWNCDAGVALATLAPKTGAVTGKAALHIINYGQPVDFPVLARIQGNFTRATVVRPEAAPLSVRVARRGSASEVAIPQLGRVGTVVFN